MDIDEPQGKKVTKKVTELEWKRTSKFVKAKKCIPEAHVLLEIPENANPLLIFEGNTSLNELVKHICDQTNLYAIQNGRDFALNVDIHLQSRRERGVQPPPLQHHFLGQNFFMRLEFFIKQNISDKN